MTLYEMTHSTTVQGNVRLSAWHGDDEIVIMAEENVDDLQYCFPDVLEDCDVDYIFCSRDGFLHIEIEAPEYVRVREEFADDWTGGYYDNDDHDVVIPFSELLSLAEGWDKTVAELLLQCEEY